MNITNETTAPVKDGKGYKLAIAREINAPCELVFRAWSDPKLMAQWYGPREVELRSLTAEVKTGGAFRVHFVSSKGDHIAIGHYTKVVANKCLQFTWQWENYAMPDSVVTVDFESTGNKTRLTLTHVGLPDEEDARDHTHGWTSMVEKFKTLVEQGKIEP